MNDRTVAAIRADLTRARASARTIREAARARLAAVQERREAVRRSAAGVPERAEQTRQARVREIQRRHRLAVAGLARKAAEAAAREAPGAAGAPWAQWKPTQLGRGEVPGPLRIGRLVLPATLALTAGPADRAESAEPVEGPEVPVLVPLLDRAHVRVTGAGSADVISALVLRALGGTAPGLVRLAGYDPEQLGGALAGFAPLSGAGLLTFVGPGGLGRLLDELVDHVRRINEAVLAGEYPSLRALAEATGRRPEPWRVAVLLGSGRPDELSRHEQAQLERLARTGVACGVHLVVHGLPVPLLSTVEEVSADRYHQLPIVVEPPPAELVTTTCRELADLVAAGPEPAVFTDLLPAEPWTQSSAAGVTAPIGEGTDGRLVEVTLADYPPHALIGGPSGTGKTNLVYAWLGALATRYSPTELEFYLLDFKEGVSFARFAPGKRDPSWLPHVRLVGVNVNTDREFGLALLRFLGTELRARAEAAKRHEVTTLAELRAEEPAGHWPRIVAVVDEFQVLLAGRDAVATEAAALLEDLARRGRSQGIHLVLASQDVSGIEALWGRSGLVGQFTLRIALPKARRILVETNLAAESIPRHHAVVNADSGSVAANRIVRIPAASDRDTWTALQHQLWRHRPPGLTPPRLFDGDAVPALHDAPDYAALGGSSGAPPAEPVALLGEAIDVHARSARLRLGRAPGRNLAVLGTRVDEAGAVLGAAGRSLARQYPAGTARFSVACLDPDSLGAARELHAALPGDTPWSPAGWAELDGFADLLAAAEKPEPRPHFLILYAVDAATARHGGRPDVLRRILHSGPERHLHVLGWWRGVARLRDDLGGVGARLDAVGAWVALDVHGSELAPLYPHPGGPTWYPRPWRGLYFDRAVHRTAETIIPYGLT
jgi:DNA segregation ATPase FtsK/SpoIIIE, S-DNA-T family